MALSYEEYVEEGHAKVSEVILDSEWEEILSLINKGEVLWGYDDVIFGNTVDYERMKLKVLNKKKSESKATSNESLEEEYIRIYKKLDEESKEIILKLCKKLVNELPV